MFNPEKDQEAFDFAFEDIQEEEIYVEPDLIKPTSNSRFESYNVKSYAMIGAFQSTLDSDYGSSINAVSYTHLRAHETLRYRG